MGKYERLQGLSPDALAKNFWKSNERFADLFNAIVYRRLQIDPSSLKEMDTDISALIADKDLLETIRRVRDTVKLSADGAQYQILAVENQQFIHYAMPFRCLLYDTLTYYHQMKTIMIQNKKERTGKGDEFLSKFKKSDKLIPCRTIVIYYGSKPWDGAKNLSELMEFSSEEDREAFNEYRCELICLNELDVFQYQFMDKDVRDFLLYISNTYRNGGKNCLEELRDMDVEVAYTAAAVTGTLQAFGKEIRENMDKGKERIDMCEAVQKVLEEKRLEGIKEGIKEGREEGLKEGTETLIANFLRNDNRISHAASMLMIPEEAVREAAKNQGIEVVE